jgi:hypothetical protein
VNPDDANALMVVMHTEWPGGEWLTDEGDLTTRGTMFALALTDHSGEVAAEAIRRLRERFPYRTGPQTADLKAALREVQGEWTLQTPALPAFDGVPGCCRNQGFGHFYRDHADEDIKARVDKLLEMPKRVRPDEGVIREAFARVVGGKS